MTTPLALVEFLSAYLGEADEHLAHANAQLLAMDAHLGRGEPVARQVRELFRALHTLKGLSAMVGVDPIVAIAHRMESLLRTADRSGGGLGKGAVDLLFEGTRAIEERVRALRDGTPPEGAPGALLEALEALEETPDRVASPAATGVELSTALKAKLAPFEQDELARAVLAGRRAIAARFAPSPAFAASGVSINSVREKLARVVDIVKVVPLVVPESAAAPAGLAFEMIGVTALSDEEIAEATGLRLTDLSTLVAPRSSREPSTATAGPLDSLDAPELEGEARRADVVRVDVSRLDAALERLASLIISRSQLAREVARLGEAGVDTRALVAIAREQSRQLRDLRSSILGLRMVPLSEVLDRVPLILRRLRRATGREVRLEVDVGRAELDKAVAERIFPAIVHLVRNAVDHGIESPEDRLAAGKSREGTLRIACAAVGNAQLELRVSDDGRGVDREALARRTEAPVPDGDAGTLALLSRPGFSTRDQADATSGRGMGMYIVRRIVVEELGGELSLRTELGGGSTFALRVPLTISIVDAFTFECGSQRFAVPLSTIEEIVDIDPALVALGPVRARSSRGVAGLIARRGGVVSVVRLDAALGLAEPVTALPVVRPKGLIVRGEGESIAFVVDRMLGQQEIVVRPLEDPLLDVPGIAGATDLGDGHPTLIVDLNELSLLHARGGVPVSVGPRA